MATTTGRLVTRRRALQRIGLGGLALALPSIIASCGGDSDDGGGGGNGAGGDGNPFADISTITWGIRAEVGSLDVGAVPSVDGILAMGLGLEGLVAFDTSLQVQPLLAESWDSTDNRTYVFTVRTGVTFWDGTKLTTDDVLYSIKRHLDPAGGSRIAGYFTNVTSVEATGENEITITLDKPDPTFVYVLTFTFITPRAFSEQLGDRLGAPDAEVTTLGTGPFRVTSFSAESGISLERNDDYWGEPPAVAAAELVFLTSPQTQLLAARSGEIDGIFDFPVQQSPDWDDIGEFSTEYAPGNRSIFLCFNVDAQPWSDVHVRRAIAHAADRAGYVKAFLAGRGEVGASIVPKSHWESLLAADDVEPIYADLATYEYDLDRAREELAQSEYPDGFTADVVYPNHEPAVGRALVSLSEAVAEIGITLNVEEVTRPEWGAQIDERTDLGLFYLGLSPDYPDPVNFMSICFAAAAAQTGGYNMANYVNDEVEELLVKQAGMTDAAQRAEALAKILRITSDELPYLPLWWQEGSMALKDDYVYGDFNSSYYVSRAFLDGVRGAE